MAMSDIVQLDYSMENEVARNATKSFAEMLEQAFEQYKKLWNEYLKLQKHCENANIVIPFEVPESKNDNNKNVDSSQMSFESTKLSSSLYESILDVCISDSTANLDDTVLSNNVSVHNKIQEVDLSRSPILLKQRSRLKRLTHGSSTSENSEENSKENITNESVDLIKNASLLEDSKIDEIECTPMSKKPKKLGISKLYNVDTTLLSNGKKLKQSKLVLIPKNEDIDQTFPSPNRNVNQNLKNGRQTKSVNEDIIEGSPDKKSKTNLKMKSLKLKKKSPAKFARGNVKKKADEFDKPNDQSSNNSIVFLKELNTSSFRQHLQPVCTPTQFAEKIELYLTNGSKPFSPIQNENTERNFDSLSTHSSPIIAEINNSCSGNTKKFSSPPKETKEVEIVQCEYQTQKRKLVELHSNKPIRQSTLLNDDTYFDLGEKLKEKATCDEIRTREKSVSPASPPAKKCLMSSFDMLPEKKVVPTHKPSKSKSDREKMIGVSCWECKQYYSNLGLSESEIQTRQNQCSRHRVQYMKKPDTPEGLWNHLFPDTLSSTFQDN